MASIDLDDLWRRASETGAPLVRAGSDGNCLVTFLWRGQATSTSVAWGVDAPLERLDGTDLWHATVELPADLRTVYYLTHDGAGDIPVHASGEGSTHLDPLNRHPFLFPGDPDDPTDVDHWTSLLELPEAPPMAAPDPPRGTMTEVRLPSAAFGEERRVAVYQPPGCSGDDLPALVVFDGYLSRTVLQIPTTLDSLVTSGRIPPVVAFFVSSGSEERRNDELAPDSPMTAFIAAELMPWARATYRVRPSAGIIAGSSLGGLAAATIGLRRPDLFGAVVAQSGSFWWPTPAAGSPGWMIREYAERPRADLRFALDVGRRETGRGPGGAPSQLRVNRRLRDVLRERGYDVFYREYTGAHDYVNWRRTFADALLAVLR